MARMDFGGRAPAPTDLRADRPRPRRDDPLAGSSRAGPAAPHRTRARRRPRTTEGHRTPRHPDLDSHRAWPELRRDPRVGRAIVENGRRRRAGPDQLEVAEE